MHIDAVCSCTRLTRFCACRASQAQPPAVTLPDASAAVVLLPTGSEAERTEVLCKPKILPLKVRMAVGEVPLAR